MHVRHVVSAVALIMAFAIEAAPAQDLHPSRRLSPIGIARTHLGDTYVKITYGRPYVRGREIFGTNTDSMSFLVPYDEVWRTGASEATEITVSGPVSLAGNRLEPGTYSVFTVPGPESWMIHVSPQTGLDGTGIFNAETGEFTPNVYDPSMDVFSVSVPRTELSEDDAVDQFTISFEETGMDVDIVLRWERTEVKIPIKAL
jgi:hypothetical protein